MKPLPTATLPSTTAPQARRQGSARTIILLVVCFCLGLAVSAVWFSRGARPEAATARPEADSPAPSPLSESTKAVLAQLSSPVDLRFYSLLDPASAPDSLRAFAGRVDQLVAEYERQAQGMLKVTRFASANTSPNAALADGVKPINLGNGEAGFLGITVALKGQRESLAQLSPEWETVLEPDLTRAIARVRTPPPTVAAATQTDPAVVEAVKRALPDLASTSVEEGTRVLRDAALQEFKRVTQESALRIKDAERQVLEARNGKSDAEQQAALKRLQAARAEQSQKQNDIAEKAQAQVLALEQLKTGAP